MDFLLLNFHCLNFLMADFSNNSVFVRLYLLSDCQFLISVYLFVNTFPRVYSMYLLFLGEEGKVCLYMSIMSGKKSITMKSFPLHSIFAVLWDEK